MKLFVLANVEIDDCVAGMKRLRADDSINDTNQSTPSLDDTLIGKLEALLSAVTLRDQWSDDDFDRIFVEDRDPVSIGFEVAALLSQAGATKGVPAVLNFFAWLVSEGDSDWLFADGPKVVSEGSPELAVAWMEAVSAADDSTRYEDDVTSVVIDGLEELAKCHRVVAATLQPQVVEALNNCQQLSIQTITDLVRLAVEMKYDDAAEAIETAFSKDRVDCGMMGDWEDVRRELHVEGRGLPMPETPLNTLDDFRRNVGVGCFSKSPVFLHGEIQEEAAEEYLRTACDAFSRSTEGKQLLQAGEEPFSVMQFLELGVHYLGVTTETIDLTDVNELLLSIFPRKVTIDESACDGVIDELVGFWMFCGRVHQLKSASAIASEITALKGQFRKAMSNPANFGMAKSFFTQGQQAGFDMTTQEGLNEFMIAHNSSIAQASSGNRVMGQRIDQVPETTPAIPTDRKKRKKLLAKKQKSAKKNRR